MTDTHNSGDPVDGHTVAAATSTAEAVTAADGATVLTVAGDRVELPAGGDLQQTRARVLERVRRAAAEHGRPVLLSARDPQGSWLLSVQPDGQIEVGHAGPDPKPPTGDLPPVPQASPTRAQPVDPTPPATPARADHPESHRGEPRPWPPAPSAPGPTPLAEPDVRVTRPRSFLPASEPTPPARTGWRGALTRLGVKVGPSPAEQAYNADVAAVSRHWAGPRTIVVANGKGGSSKTPVVIGLSAVFARFGGGGVCAWSNHQMRGTLGWHTVQDPHAATTQDLLAAAPSLLERAGRASDLARFVHHQPADRYDVLQADPTKTSDQQRTGWRDVDTIHQVLCRFYRLIVMDSDNDESTSHWLRMIDRADQLVVATTTDAVRAETGRLMLEDLRGRNAHAAGLADRAVVVVSQAHSDEPPAASVAAKFVDYGLRAATIPYDQGMKQFKLTYDGLNPATQRAYLAAAAAVAEAITAADRDHRSPS